MLHKTKCRRYKIVETWLNFSKMKFIFFLAVYLVGDILAIGDISKELKRNRSKRDLIYWNRQSNSVLKYTYKRKLRVIENADDANDIMKQIQRYLKIKNEIES